MDAARMLKANRKVQGKPCGWCEAILQLGEDAAVCTTCAQEHHRPCWESRAGCSTGGCANAPLHRLDLSALGGGEPASMAEMPPGMMACPTCKRAISIGDPFCSACKSVNSPDGIYHGPRTSAPGAVAALVYGIIGLVICGVILGPLAISKGNGAKRAMAENPTLGGGGLATAGVVLGVIDLVMWALVLVAKLAAATGR